MEDTDFFDILYQGWSKTTGAETTFWMPEDDEDFPGLQSIWAVDQNEDRKAVASYIRSEDAAFITAIHGCFGDLVRRLHMAVDEAERKDRERDDTEVELAELEIERQGLAAKVECLEEAMRKMDQDLIKAQADAVYWEAEGRGRGLD